MTYRVVIDELVIEKDIKKISHPDQKRIFRAIRNKLTTNPKEFGVPLRGKFSSFWKLRVGPFRIIYKIEEEKVRVYVIMIGYRRNAEVYRKLMSRLNMKQPLLIARVEQNKELNLDLQVSLAAGVGRNLIQNNRMILLLAGGLSANNEKYTGEDSSINWKFK